MNNYPPPDACSYLKPISFSGNDTDETVQQIVDYLVVYEELCERKK